MEKDNDDLKEVTIIVNGAEKPVRETELTYDDVVNLAFPDAPKREGIIFTVDYRENKETDKHESLDKGDSVKVKEGMVFDVEMSDQS